MRSVCLHDVKKVAVAVAAAEASAAAAAAAAAAVLSFFCLPPQKDGSASCAKSLGL